MKIPEEYRKVVKEVQRPKKKKKNREREAN